MNKVYNTVWNESTGRWVVTSELTRKGGRRPRQIRRTALAGLIISVMSSTPALANGEIFYPGGVGDGDTVYVDPYNTAQNTVLFDNGTLTILSYGSASRTTINEGGYMNTSGLNYNDFPKQQSISETTINNGGLMYILAIQANISETTINSGGEQAVGNYLKTIASRRNSITNTIINDGGRQFIFGATNASETTINGGYQYILSGSNASETTINSGGNQNIYNSGSATSTTINNGGYQYISSGGNASETTINSGGSQNIYNSGSATSTTINNGGYQYISSGGSASETTINSGGMLNVENVGSATLLIQNNGGAVVTNTSAVLNGTNTRGSFSIADGNASNMLLENGGYLHVLSGHQASDTTVGDNGELEVDSGGVLRGTTTLLDNSSLAGSAVTNEGNLYYLNNNTADFTGSLTGSGSLTQEGGNTRFSGILSQDGGITLKSGGAMTMDALQAITDVTAQPGTTLTLDNGTILTGNITGDSSGTGDVTVKGASVWYPEGDSSVDVLTLNNGTIDFHPSAISRQASTFQPVSLTLNTLSGNGMFRMNTDIASHTGDMLKVTGNASGNFVLDIKNTGLEPVSAGTPLQVVQTSGGNAVFTLNGGKVDAGTWEYGLSKENTDWYLKTDTSQPGTDNPSTDNPSTDNPSTDNPSTDNPDTGTPLPPVRQTTKSADAVLSMATAPAYIFNSELENLRLRHGDFMQNTRSPGGVWGRYLGSDNRINGGAGSGYSLSQNGFETGGDKVFDLGSSSLALGAFVSWTDNRINHNRGGNSTTGSTGGGLYATWFDNNGYYLDGVLKYNRFSNELHTWMSDGTAVKGDYSQNGFGGSLEAGRTFSLNENIWTQPYIRTTAFRANGKDISLNNGMKASIGALKSVQAEAGVNLGMNLDVAGKTVRPYLKAAISHEFSDNNRVRINDRYGFTNDISGTTGTYGAGVNVQLTPNAGIWAEARYQKGEKTESPVTGSVGFRFNF